MKEYRKIFDFFFSGVEVPQKVKEKFFSWFSSREDDPDVTSLLREYWDETPAQSEDFDIDGGLERLFGSIESGKERTAPRLGRSPKELIFRVVATVAASLAIFVGGWALAKHSPSSKQTLLLASDEAIASYTLSDGSRVHLNRGSSLSFTGDFAKGERKVRLQGEAYFDVAKDPEHPFIVEMDNSLEIKVLGTSFNAVCDEDSDRAEVILKSGSVQFGDAGGMEKVILKPGQRLVWDNGMTSIDAVNVSSYCRWYERRIAFDNALLSDIAGNLSHKYRKDIRLSTPGMEGKRLSLTIGDESLEDVLDLVCMLLPVSWKEDGDTIIIENKPQTH